MLVVVVSFNSTHLLYHHVFHNKVGTSLLSVINGNMVLILALLNSLYSVLILWLAVARAKGTLCNDGLIWTPAPLTSFYWDLTNTVTIDAIKSTSAQAMDLDVFYLTKEQVDLIHSLNRALICYIDTTYESYRPDAYKFTPEVLGNDMDGWPGQKV